MPSESWKPLFESLSLEEQESLLKELQNMHIDAKKNAKGSSSSSPKSPPNTHNPPSSLQNTNKVGKVSSSSTHTSRGPAALIPDGDFARFFAEEKASTLMVRNDDITAETYPAYKSFFEKMISDVIDPLLADAAAGKPRDDGIRALHEDLETVFGPEGSTEMTEIMRAIESDGCTRAIQRGDMISCYLGEDWENVMDSTIFRGQTNAKRWNTTRIFRRDADRTVSNEVSRTRFIKNCIYSHYRPQCYHQGGGFLMAFLMVFLPIRDVCKAYWYFHFSIFRRCYYREVSLGLGTDSYAFYAVTKKVMPRLVEHLAMCNILQDSFLMFAQKWFIGCGLHFLPFSWMAIYFNDVFRRSALTYGKTNLSPQHAFAFQFGIAWLEFLEPYLMECKNTSEANCLLKNDNPKSQTKAHPIIFKLQRDNPSLVVGESLELQNQKAADDLVWESVFDRARKIDLHEICGEDFADFRERQESVYQKVVEERNAKLLALNDEVSDVEGDFSDED